MIHTKQNTVCQDLQTLLENKDVTFVIGDQEFQAHKAILAARSQVFSAMFKNDCEETRQGKVTIIDVTVEAFEELLNYIYSGKVSSVEKYTADLFVAADKVCWVVESLDYTHLTHASYVLC